MAGDWQFLQIKKKGGCIVRDRVGDGDFENFGERVTRPARMVTMVKRAKK